MSIHVLQRFMQNGRKKPLVLLDTRGQKDTKVLSTKGTSTYPNIL